MKAIILGSGLIGVTQAYFLHKEGFEVEVIDRQPESGLECSYSNGAQLSYCHAEPWSSPASLIKGIKWLGKEDAPLLFRFRNDPQMWRWVLSFVGYCTSKQVKIGSEKILKLGLLSRKILHENEDYFNFDFSYTKGGKTFIFKTKEEQVAAVKQARFQEQFGSEYKILSQKEVLDYEPALFHHAGNIMGGLRDPLDEAADALKYTQALAKKLQKAGVKFHYNTTIEKINIDAGKVTSIKTDKGDFKGNIYVLSLGAYSPILSKTAGFYLPIYPLKGYSITIDINDENSAPKNSITDAYEKVVYSRVGNQLRVAGTAEFAGYNNEITKTRIDMMKNATRRIFPMCGDIDNASEWACLRPSAPDGVPILGNSPLKNLYLNTGHGTLGWTQTFSSAKLVTDVIQKRKTDLNLEWFKWDRF
jgi:D-amino-acid dehydrogenase